MIAKIYGKSAKFVQNKQLDAYKKPKIHHMKDILKKKQSETEKKPETPGAITIGKTGVRKIKIIKPQNINIKNKMVTVHKNIVNATPSVDKQPRLLEEEQKSSRPQPY